MNEKGGALMLEKRYSFIILCIFFLVIVAIPSYTYAGSKPESIYTVQAASFHALESAKQTFENLIQSLDKKNRDHVRIEKIGKFYSLRLGRFKNHASAEKFFNSVKSHLPSAMVMKAYYKEERIVHAYKLPQQIAPPPVTKQKPAQQPVSQAPPQQKESIVEKKTELKDTPKKEVPLKPRLTEVANLVDKKDFKKALALLKPEIANRPNNPELNAWYGTVLLKMKQPPEALTYLQRAVQLSPDVPDYHNSLGYCLFFLNRPDNAINEFHKAVNLNPQHIDALTGLGIVYAQGGKKESAMDIYEKLKDLDRQTAERLLKVIEGKLL
jgi:tetratricopeptide (TPR) repeat protein